jgi:hypothetical protein
MFSATSFLDPRCESSGPKQPGNGRVPSQRLDIGQSRSTMRPVVRYRDKAMALHVLLVLDRRGRPRCR